MLNASTIERFEKALPAGFSALKDLAKQFASEGLSQVAVFHVFDSYRQHLYNAGRDLFEQAVIFRCMENIAGWCSQHGWWFEHGLTKHEIDKHSEANI